jgi:thiol-disulfide isomerase/thioredoxin
MNDMKNDYLQSFSLAGHLVGLFLMLVLVGSGSTEAQSKVQKPRADYGKNNFTLTGLDGKKISLNDLGGKVVLVNIWAPWCGPCRKEAPGFVNIYKKYHDRGFEIISVAVNTNETDVRAFVRDYHLSWPVGIGDEIAVNYKTYGLPDNYLFKKDGSVARHFVGYTAEEALSPLIEDLLPPLPVTGKSR